MIKEDKFLSIHKDASNTFFENKSEFIANAFYVETKEEAENKIIKIKENHKNATHNCFAYIIGEDKLIQKYSDDGEPKGTAGIPILEVLKKRNITNCLIVVTRYFGGTLLGAGGLVRAYTTASVLALEKAQIVFKELFYVISIKVDYTFLGKIEYEIKNLHLDLIRIDYLEKANIKVFIKAKEFKNIEKKLIDQTSNNCVIYIEKEMIRSVFL